MTHAAALAAHFAAQDRLNRAAVAVHAAMLAYAVAGRAVCESGLDWDVCRTYEAAAVTLDATRAEYAEAEHAIRLTSASAYASAEAL